MIPCRDLSVLSSHKNALQMEHDPPSEKTGWSVKFLYSLYSEYEYPITVQMVVGAPSSESKIHNHATWGIVAIIGGEEKNTFWRQAADNP